MFRLSVVAVSVLCLFVCVESATLTLYQGAPNCADITSTSPISISANLTLYTVINYITTGNDTFYCYNVPGTTMSYLVTNRTNYFGITRRYNQSCQDPANNGIQYVESNNGESRTDGTQCLQDNDGACAFYTYNSTTSQTCPLSTQTFSFTAIVNLNPNAFIPPATPTPTNPTTPVPTPTPSSTGTNPNSPNTNGGDQCMQICGIKCSSLQTCSVDFNQLTCACTIKTGALAGIIVGVVVVVLALCAACCFLGKCGCFAYRKNQANTKNLQMH